MRVEIDTVRCTGHGICEELAEDVFEIQDDGIAYLIGDEEIAPSHEAAVRASVEQCPAQALRLKEG